MESRKYINHNEKYFDDKYCVICTCFPSDNSSFVHDSFLISGKKLLRCSVLLLLSGVCGSEASGQHDYLLILVPIYLVTLHSYREGHLIPCIPCTRREAASLCRTISYCPKNGFFRFDSDAATILTFSFFLGRFSSINALT